MISLWEELLKLKVIACQEPPRANLWKKKKKKKGKVL